jgi:hypothetical protein
MLDSKCGQNGGHEPFLARGWILQNYLCIFDKTSTCEPKNDFLEKSWANYDAALVQIFPTSSWTKTINP